jgi:hypothetical protein
MMINMTLTSLTKRPTAVMVSSYFVAVVTTALLLLLVVSGSFSSNFFGASPSSMEDKNKVR